MFKGAMTDIAPIKQRTCQAPSAVGKQRWRSSVNRNALLAQRWPHLLGIRSAWIATMMTEPPRSLPPGAASLSHALPPVAHVRKGIFRVLGSRPMSRRSRWAAPDAGLDCLLPLAAEIFSTVWSSARLMRRFTFRLDTEQSYPRRVANTAFARPAIAEFRATACKAI